MRLGAIYDPKKGMCEFNVWAPHKKRVSLILEDKEYSMSNFSGYWQTYIKAKPGARYYFKVDNLKRPDPASRSQPLGVHGPSEIINPTFSWQDKNWENILLKNLIIYELHVGAFTKEGTFEAIIPRLNDLKKTGINAIELMPIAQCPGKRNWGYDGVFPFAVQNSYGGASQLKKLVNACHKKGIAVILDVVYNHLGLEGNYLNDYAPYFTDNYKTPWGPAINFDDSYCDEVRDFFIENALYWLKEFHMDGLRLDSVPSIFDLSARPFLMQLSERIEKEVDKKVHLIAESYINKSALIKSRKSGGYGLNAEWLEDFHRALHSLITGERAGYYLDYGSLGKLVKCINHGHVFDGLYSKYYKKSYGDSSKSLPSERFIVFTQNHDQVGNRIYGERLSKLTDFSGLKMAAGVMFLSSYIPLIFMGEEYAETNPFLYFTNHSDKALIKAVRDGRKKELHQFGFKGTPPNPQSSDTFNDSKLSWEKRNRGRHKVMKRFYSELIRLRKKYGGKTTAKTKDGLLILEKPKVFAIFNFSDSTKIYKATGRKIFDSDGKRWIGNNKVTNQKITLAPKSFIIVKNGKA